MANQPVRSRAAQIKALIADDESDDYIIEYVDEAGTSHHLHIPRSTFLDLSLMTLRVSTEVEKQRGVNIVRPIDIMGLGEDETHEFLYLGFGGTAVVLLDVPDDTARKTIDLMQQLLERRSNRPSSPVLQ